MITCLDHPHPTRRTRAVRPIETGFIFPFRNAELQLLPVPVPSCDLSGGFSFSALPSRRAHANQRVELTTYCQAPLADAYECWTECEHLPHFMRAVAGSSDDAAAARSWHLRLRDEEAPWEAVTTERTPLKRISWWSTGSATHRNRGTVSFDAVGGRTTKVSVSVEFYESHAQAVTEETLRTLRAALDRCLDRIHSNLMRCPALGPGCATL